MSSENLRFSVEESVWFQKGQEVSELVSISLDPDIVIQEHDQYVSIRGALQLTGEYRIDENASEEEERDFTSVRLVNEVKTREDGISVLNHRFPVDITIPQNRVQSLDEVYVSIEAFDYELPKRGCLQIIADLSISGIQNVTQTTPPPDDPVEEPAREAFPVASQEVEAPEKELELVRSSSFEEEPVQEQTFEEVRAEQEPVSEEVEEEEVVLQSPDEVVLHKPENEEVEEVSETNNSHQEEADDDLFVPFEVEARREAYQEPEELLQVVEEQVEEVIEEKEEEVVATLTPQIEVKARHDNKLTFGSDNPNKETVTAVEERSEKEQTAEASNQSSTRSENELLLTKIFGRDEVEEHTTMKICIVQSGDTIDKIAERYEISTQQLVRVNTLNEDSLSEGQLLYIPVQVNI
ncbi:stage VI sporulation protein D [Fredinandcohnia sp. 179-A 10B2 NHS]|uniref:stage VI sporulation protein D n=1 Tax=Fredinandcohnia sp. 179-A 10B2 NHS TaxID=3235176 RepID=UPI0039A01673